MTTTESRAKMVGYWVATALAALAFITGGAFDVARGEQVRSIMSHLGYPAYFAALLGVWKILGGLAILAPRMPRLKEWAYAGMFFDLSGAAISHGSVGDPPRADSDAARDPGAGHRVVGAAPEEPRAARGRCGGAGLGQRARAGRRVTARPRAHWLC